MLIRPAANSQIRDEDLIVRPKFSNQLLDGIVSPALSGLAYYYTKGRSSNLKQLSSVAVANFVFQFSGKHWWSRNALDSIIQSRNSGRDWSADEIPIKPTGYTGVIAAVNPNRSDVAVMGYSKSSPLPRSTILYRSTDLGRTWAPCFEIDDAATINNGGLVCLGNETYMLVDREVRSFFSYDNGQTWSYIPIFSEGVSEFRQAVSLPNGLVVAIQGKTDEFIRISLDHGQTWYLSGMTSGAGKFWLNVESSEDCIMAVSIDSSSVTQVYRSLDFGATFQDVTPLGWPSTDREWSLVWGNKPGRFYLTSIARPSFSGFNGLWVTEDNGDTWELISSGVVYVVQTNGGGMAIALEYDGNALVTKNYGRNWTPMDVPEPLTYPQRYYRKGW